MARLIPNLSNEEIANIKSKGERDLYKKCKELPEDYIVLFSLPWIHQTPSGEARDGETDFVIIHKDRGLLTVEVKGGGIKCEQEFDKWYSTDRFGVEHEIKNPFKQALKSKYQISDYLKDSNCWVTSRPTTGHAVFFPSISNKQVYVSADKPIEIIGDSDDLNQLQKWIDVSMSYWGSNGIGKVGMQRIEKIFCSTIEAKSLLRDRIAEDEYQRIQLTEDQKRILRGLSSAHRAKITGSAGTGKTVLALDRAKTLSEQGQNVLLLCYNKPLCEYMKDWCHFNISDASVEVRTFHSFCSKLIKDAGAQYMNEAKNEYPGEDAITHLAVAGMYASENYQYKYDAIIIDEGQDFHDEWWLVIEPHLKNSDSSLFIFLDENQKIFDSTRGELPAELVTYHLNKNCRNTSTIHTLAYSFIEESSVTDYSSFIGQPVEYIVGHNQKQQSDKIYHKIQGLINNENIDPVMIVVLTPSVGHKDYFYDLSMRRLPGGTEWSIQKVNPSGILLDTMPRFKGLESMVVICWIDDTYRSANVSDAKLLYTTFSRATSKLIICGTKEICDLMDSQPL